MHRVRLLHERASDTAARVRGDPGVPQRRFRTRPSIRTRVRLVTDLLDLPPETQAAFAPDRGQLAAHRASISPRLLDAGSRLERGALAGVAAHPKLEPLPRGARPRALRRRAAPARPRAAARPGRARRRADAAPRGAVRDGRHRRDRRGDDRADAAPPARAPPPPRSSPRRSPTTCSSCSSGSPRCAPRSANSPETRGTIAPPIPGSSIGRASGC